jgi:DNA primase
VIDKKKILQTINFEKYYQTAVPSLKINGKLEVQGLCPFHDDHRPSLSVNIKTGLFRCFACGVGGDVFTFYQRINNVDFKTALRELAKEVE